MSEAISGIIERVIPHVASLMRATAYRALLFFTGSKLIFSR
jgi:hypothetical protein